MEPAALIPLQMLKHDGKVVLVGDPKQLPATVVSRAAEAAGLSRSLFERLQQVVPLHLYSWAAATAKTFGYKEKHYGAAEESHNPLIIPLQTRRGRRGKTSRHKHASSCPGTVCRV